MAKKTVLVSDLSGQEIQDTGGASIRITFRDARRGSYELDVTGDEPEIATLMAKGRKVARRGRKPATV
jgi:hypothetical protein